MELLAHRFLSLSTWNWVPHCRMCSFWWKLAANPVVTPLYILSYFAAHRIVSLGLICNCLAVLFLRVDFLMFILLDSLRFLDVWLVVFIFYYIWWIFSSYFFKYVFLPLALPPFLLELSLNKCCYKLGLTSFFFILVWLLSILQVV